MTVDFSDLFYSQSSLGTYQTCQLKFKRRYLEGLFWPGGWALDPGEKAKLEQGRIFHLMAQRYYARGKDPLEGLTVSEDVKDWVARLIEFRPFDPEVLFLSEQEVRFRSSEARMVAKYDLLMFKPDGRVLIYDWKTTGTSPRQEYLEKHLQTIVYRYVLCAAGEAVSPGGPIKPGNVTMLYWNPKFPTNYTPFAYSEGQFARDGEFLQRLIHEIQGKSLTDFLASIDQRRCAHCEYSPICLGEKSTGLDWDEEDLELDWDNLDEFNQW